MHVRNRFLATLAALTVLSFVPLTAEAHGYYKGPRYSFNFSYGSPYYYGGYYGPRYRFRGPHFGPSFYYEVPVIREYQVTRLVEPAPLPSGPPPVQNWYFCEPAGEYYPYVSECEADWKVVPAAPRK